MKRYLILLAAILLLNGCSLLKFSLDTGDTPLTREQINTRLTVRAFYKDFSLSVISTADSIYRSTDSLQLKLRAIEWKLRSTSICAQAAFGSIPEISLLNTWLLCSSMNLYMKEAPDSLLFAEYSPLARQCAASLDSQIVSIASKILSKERYAQMQTFVRQNTDPSVPPTSQDVTLRWISYIGASDSTYLHSTGSVAQSIADMSEKISGYSSQWGNELSWNKEMLDTWLDTDHTQAEIRSRMDSLYRQFDRVVVVLEHTPQIADAALDYLNEQVTKILESFNTSVDHVFIDLGQQRTELQDFIDSQRVRLMAQTDSLAVHAVNTAMEALPSLLGRMLFYLTASLVVLFSIPFILGYLLGRARERRKKNNRSPESQS